MAGWMMVFHCKGRNYFSLDVFDNTETASSLIRYKHNSSFQLLLRITAHAQYSYEVSSRPHLQLLSLRYDKNNYYCYEKINYYYYYY